MCAQEQLPDVVIEGDVDPYEDLWPFLPLPPAIPPFSNDPNLDLFDDFIRPVGEAYFNAHEEEIKEDILNELGIDIDGTSDWFSEHVLQPEVYVPVLIGVGGLYDYDLQPFIDDLEAHLSGGPRGTVDINSIPLPEISFQVPNWPGHLAPTVTINTELFLGNGTPWLPPADPLNPNSNEIQGVGYTVIIDY